MEFNKCIALNSLVKKAGTRVGSRFDAVSVEFSMFSLGKWSADIEFPMMMFDDEVKVFVNWAIANVHNYFIFGSKDRIILSVQ